MTISKKGEISTSQLAAIILIIAGFSVILFFIFLLKPNAMIDRETCHQSVIFRATLPVFGNLKDYVPLKCKTEKICITSGFFGGSCKEFKGVKGVTKVKVNSVTQIEKIFAQQTIDCWSLMGEGKLQIFSHWMAEKYGLGKVYSSCVICTRIAFDKESLVKSKIDLGKMDVMRYMQTHLVPNKNYTYYAYILRESNPKSLPVTAQSHIPFGKINASGDLEKNKDMEGLTKEGISASDVSAQMTEDIQYKEDSILFMQINGPEYLETIKNDVKLIAGIAGTSAVIAPSKTLSAGRAIAAGGWYSAAIGAIVGTYQMGSVAWNRAITASYCSDVNTNKDLLGGDSGCSVTRVVKYDMVSIKQYCNVIESIP